MDMAIVAGVLAVMLIIVLVMYFRQFSRHQDALEDRAFLEASNSHMKTQRDNWQSAYDKLSHSAAQHSKTLVAILDFLMEEAKVDELYILDKGGIDKALFDYVHRLKSSLKAEAQASTDYREIIDKLRIRRAKVQGERDALAKFKKYVHDRSTMQGIDKCEEMNAKNGCRIGSRLDLALFVVPARVQEPDTGTTRPDTLDGLATVLGREHDDPRADVAPGLHPSLMEHSGPHGDEAPIR
jgi:hypothetical protein